MTRTWVWLSAFLSVGFALGGSLAHLYELPHKIHLSSEDYLTVQQIYRGWNRLGFAVGGALLSTLILTVGHRKDPGAFRWLLAAFTSVAVTQVVFWVWTYPVNAQTVNWTVLPPDWMSLRARWEYSHAAGAVLNVLALSTLALAALRRGSRS